MYDVMRYECVTRPRIFVAHFILIVLLFVKFASTGTAIDC